jgi:hypothetical protein
VHSAEQVSGSVASYFNFFFSPDAILPPAALPLVLFVVGLFHVCGIGAALQENAKFTTAQINYDGSNQSS